MKDDKENDIEMNDGDSTESPADGNNMHANPESEKKPHKQNERTVVTTSIDQKQAQTETVSTESRQTGSGAE